MTSLTGTRGARAAVHADLWSPRGARPALPEASGAGCQPGTGGTEMGTALLSPLQPTLRGGNPEVSIFLGII